MLWQQDNDQAASETLAHNVRASAIHNADSGDKRITMTMDNRRILTTKITTTTTGVCKADPGRMMIMMKTTGKEISMKMITMKIKEVMAGKMAEASKAGVRGRVLAA